MVFFVTIGDQEKFSQQLEQTKSLLYFTRTQPKKENENKLKYLFYILHTAVVGSGANTVQSFDPAFVHNSVTPHNKFIEYGSGEQMAQDLLLVQALQLQEFQIHSRI